ncbi:MAG: leucine-rich repeat domain-containing protein [Anaerolineaceae bacterium]|nr:leucine-rich repeat domain-containing protein [Anaerolineaceae bacterium]
MTVKRVTIILVCVLVAAVAGALIFGNDRLGNSNTPSVSNSSQKWVYEVQDGNAVITAYNGRDSVIEIPSEINDFPVTSLGSGLFADNTRLREVTIPDSVTTLGSSVFANCTELSVVRLSPNLTGIPGNAFLGCRSLKTISLTNGIRSIGSGAFSGCIGFTYIDIPNTVTSIGADAFLNCEALSDISIPRTVTNIGSHAFKGTPWLTAQTDTFVIVGNQILIKYNGIAESVEVPLGVTQITDAFEDNLFPLEIILPSSLTSIGQHAFSGCRSLEVLEIPESVRNIGDSAFRGCSHLNPITLPPRLTSIGPSAFQSCSALERLIIPNGVKTLPKLAFANCDKLRMLQIPESVETIASDAMIYSGITELRVVKDSAAEQFAIDNGYAYVYEQQSNDEFIYQQLDDGIQVIMYTGNTYDVVIPEELSGYPVTSLSDILFQHNSFVRSVNLPDTITRIADYSFANMSELRSVVLPETLTEIGEGAFMNDPFLADLAIPESVTSIAETAFIDCPSLIILAPKGSYAYDWAVKAGIRVKDNKQIDAAMYRFAKPMGQVLITGYDGYDIVPELPRTNEFLEFVSGISDDVFNGKEVSEITIPEGYESIGERSFANDPVPLNITIPRSVTHIGDSCFEGSDVVIHGYNGSYAEEFSRTHRIKFLVIHEWEL